MAEYQSWQEAIFGAVRSRSFPLSVKFLREGEEFPLEARRPGKVLGKRITICQAITMARIYGWAVGLDRSDIICVPAVLAWGMSGAQDARKEMISLMLSVGFAQNEDVALSQIKSMILPREGEISGITMAPLAKTSWDFDVVVIYGNPAQIMRIVQALRYLRPEEISGDFQGKIACVETLYAASATQKPRISIPGMGDRIFSMTQDDELAISLPVSYMPDLIKGLHDAGKPIGARYPVTFYQNFEPVFPKQYQEVAERLKLFTS
ncbi:MAG: DUF169 domain-containing protein [Thermodesulforhabdaceae bacterium]|jgi:uncharacterized protein (DUF169 family)